jgi:KDO2-lipid IV(A) lauroyltransferase
MARASLAFTSCFSLRVLQASSRVLAPVASLASKRVRASIRTNLALCFPELTESERRALGRRSLRQGVATMLELGPLWRWKTERVLRLVREVEGLEHLEAARAAHQGVVLLGPHFGAWEIIGLYLSSFMPMTSLYRAPRVPGLERVYRGARERLGARLVSADVSGVRELFRALRRGELVAVLPDQDPGRGAGIYAPFFGVPANTSTLTARLLARPDVVPILGWGERLAHGRGYRLHFERLDSAELACGDLERSTRALNLAMEGLIRRRPEQYLWSYRRFRHPPNGRRNPYRHGIAECMGLAPEG